MNGGEEICQQEEVLGHEEAFNGVDFGIVGIFGNVVHLVKEIG